ncbi:MAG: hypothetical protein KGK30_02415, partial [Elusimicrobia bacterium]|nr:hypothetical protein [Elusimicrobiota bacterium]
TRLDGLFVEGMARGTRGQWDLLQGRYLNAYFDGRRAIKYLRLVSRLDPDYHDADLGLGVFEYQIAHFSGLLASIGGLLGLRGSEPEGLRLLRSAMEHGRYAKEQAAQFLATIYIVDRGDWASALPIVLRLRRDFPDSPYAELLELEARWKLGDRTASLKLGRSLFARAQADPEGFRRKLLSLACGLTGESCLDAGQAASMRAWLEAAIASVDKPERPPQGQDLDYLVFLRLLRGQANDALGASGAAASDYDWVRQQPDVLGSRARAQACLRGGCPASEQIDYLRSLARPPSR